MTQGDALGKVIGATENGEIEVLLKAGQFNSESPVRIGGRPAGRPRGINMNKETFLLSDCYAFNPQKKDLRPGKVCSKSEKFARSGRFTTTFDTDQIDSVLAGA